MSAWFCARQEAPNGQVLQRVYTRLLRAVLARPCHDSGQCREGGPTVCAFARRLPGFHTPWHHAHWIALRVQFVNSRAGLWASRTAGARERYRYRRLNHSMPVSKGPQLFLFEKLPPLDLEFAPLPDAWTKDPKGLHLVHAYRMLVPACSVRAYSNGNDRPIKPSGLTWHTPTTFPGQGPDRAMRPVPAPTLGSISPSIARAYLLASTELGGTKRDGRSFMATAPLSPPSAPWVLPPAVPKPVVPSPSAPSVRPLPSVVVASVSAVPSPSVPCSSYSTTGACNGPTAVSANDGPVEPPTAVSANDGPVEALSPAVEIASMALLLLGSPGAGPPPAGAFS